MESTKNQALKDLLSIFLTKIVKLDITTTLTLSTLITVLMNGLDVSLIYAQVIDNLYLVLLIICVLSLTTASYFLLKRKKTEQTSCDSSMTRINLYNEMEIKLLNYYMKHNPTFYSNDHNMNYGGPLSTPRFDCNGEMILDDLITPEENSVIFFNDEIHCVEGKIVSKTYDQSVKDGQDVKTKKVPFLELYLKNTTITTVAYMDLLDKWRQEKFVKDQEITVCSVKIFSLTNGNSNKKYHDHLTTMYSGKLRTPEERYSKYILPYFSPCKADLWSYINTIHYNPEKIIALGQNPGVNLLLHGPPGSGKSTFAYRVAMATDRHLISLDLTSMLDDRAAIYRIFQAPNWGEGSIKPKKYIILLEEFDITIDYLVKMKTVEKKPAMTFGAFGGLEEDSKAIKKSFGFNQQRDFCLEDLLELFQGAVPMPGGIIMATTNHFEKIKDVLPALFRPGRLTPVHFDYLDWATLQELCMYYFKEELTLSKVDRVEFPTSQITEMAVKAVVDKNKGFEWFQRKLGALLETQSKK